MKAKVSVLRVSPDTILQDIDRTIELAGVPAGGESRAVSRIGAACAEETHAPASALEHSTTVQAATVMNGRRRPIMASPSAGCSPHMRSSAVSGSPCVAVNDKKNDC